MNVFLVLDCSKEAGGENGESKRREDGGDNRRKW